jgi:hypothetical protein
MLVSNRVQCAAGLLGRPAQLRHFAKSPEQEGDVPSLSLVRSRYAATTAAAVSLCDVEFMTFETCTFGGPSRNLSKAFKTAG